MLDALPVSDPTNLANMAVAMEVASACYPNATDAVPLQRRPVVAAGSASARVEEFLQGSRSLESVFSQVWGVGVSGYFAGEEPGQAVPSEPQPSWPSEEELALAVRKWTGLIDPPSSPEGAALPVIFGAVLQRKLVELGVRHPALQDDSAFAPIPGNEYQLAAWLARRLILDAAKDDHASVLYREVSLRILTARFGISREVAEDALDLTHIASELPELLPRLVWLVLRGIPNSAPPLPGAEMQYAAAAALEYCVHYSIRFND